MKISAGYLSRISDMIEETLEVELSKQDALELFQLLQEFVDERSGVDDGSDKAYDDWRDRQSEGA